MIDLNDRLTSLGISSAYASAFIGLNLYDDAWEIVHHSDEICNLTIIQFLRLCVVAQVSPVDLLPDDASRFEGLLDPAAPTITAQLAQSDTDYDVLSDIVGWEASALRTWLSDDFNFAQMNMTAANDLCMHLKLSLAGVLDLYLLRVKGDHTQEVCY